MRSLLHKLRGLMGIGLTWGVSWAAIGTVVALVIGVVDPTSLDPGESILGMGLAVGGLGLVSGVGFGVVLAFTEKQKMLVELSLPRVALWGALGAAAFPLLTSMNDILVFVTCPLGALFAASSVAIARAATVRDSESAPLLSSDLQSQ